MKENKTLLKKILEIENSLKQIKDQLIMEEKVNRINETIDRYIKFRSYSINIDENDYEKIYDAAHRKHVPISKFIKNEYWEDFIHGGPNVYNVEYKYMLPSIANRRLSGGKRSIALALNEEEDRLFNKKLNEWGIDLKNKRDILKFFITQFLYGHKTLKNNSGLIWQRCVSKEIDAFSYDSNKKELYVMFKNGSVYLYYNVPQHVYDELQKVESKGTYHNRNIKNIFKYKKINI